jgi:outer membrane biosynthesis protein TonB
LSVKKSFRFFSVFHRLNSVAPDDSEDLDMPVAQGPDMPASQNEPSAEPRPVTPAEHPEAPQEGPLPEAVVNVDFGLIEAGGEVLNLDHIL